MPTVRLLKTTLGGYDLFNLTSNIIASFFKKIDISAQVNGIATTFNTDVAPVPFVAGTLEVLLSGTEQNGVPGVTITEHPGLGTFDLNFAPTVIQLPLVVKYIIA